MYLKCLHFTFSFESHFCWIQNSRLVGLASFPSPFRPSFLLLYSSLGYMPLYCLLLVFFPVRNLIFIPWYATCFSLWLNLSFLHNWFWAIWLCLGIGHFPSYFWYLGFPGLLDLWIHSFHQVWKFLSHYFFKYCLCPFLSRTPIMCLLALWCCSIAHCCFVHFLSSELDSFCCHVLKFINLFFHSF